ncbi:hypothetical protein [Streptomyces sp. SID13031]|uniref:hypothetical protein n=1 Tax=Streptomyces sp. SID13031 TaxID=2706046 RepID=UPI0013CB307E|nr:hypothetical protein [Streptomyces sp. SID13031]NEA30377.1 hypothetical protein [Streptomyces sp. SID13031]
MSTSARLDVEELVIVPGSPAQCQVQVANRGSIVEAYTLTPVADLAGYAVIEPATLSLYPDAEGTATITITVPREAVIEAGDVAFGVLVRGNRPVTIPSPSWPGGPGRGSGRSCSGRRRRTRS